MSAFYAWLSRLRLIRRWGLMHATLPENDAEHSLQTAMIAHGLAVIAKERYHQDVSPESVATLAMYHDAGEIFTGDLPTPVKHHDGVIHDAYSRMEQEALKKLLHTLPQDLQGSFITVLQPDESSYAWKLVKAADRISAYAHCMEELRAGNREFADAGRTLLQAIEASDLPEVQAFMQEFGQAFSCSLDELGGRCE
jgi:5'-deoxynucleotidase